MDESISRYRILKNLDATDGGRVYLAEDPLLGRVVVHLFGAASAERSFDAGDAAQAWLDVNHPNVARVLDVGEHDGRLFVVRPFIEGTPLVEFLRRSQMPSADALSWMRDLASALAYLHRRSIVHGNLSPTGLIVDLAGSIRVVYLPLERSVDAVDADVVRYASPERLTGAAVNAGSDIFVFGAILYEVLTGRPAFPGTDVPQIIRAILNAPPELSYGSPRLNATLVRLVEGCLQGDPRSRYQEIDLVVSGLDVAQRTERIAALVADATAQLADGKYSEALETCQQALSFDPDHVSARELLRRARATADSKASVGEREASVRALDENVQFTVYRRSVVAPERWYPMLAFAHLAERRSEAPAYEPDPVAEVHRQAEQVLGQGAADFQQVTQDSKRPIPERGQLRFVPAVEGIEFNPLERSFRWTESVHREEFRLRASRALDGRIARGVVSVYLGHLLVAEITLAIRVDSQASAAESIADSARPYRRIFASYSHRDTAIVEEFEYHVQSLGDEYLRDVTLLRAGEVWTPRLAEVIASADIFQLFWSWNSLQSPFVRAEWEYALALRRKHYIRPVYWENPFPATIDLPPPSLRALHFKEIRPRAVATDRPLPGATARGDCILLEVTTAQPTEPRRVNRLVFSNEGGTIGRRNDNALVLPDSRVSGRHAVISYRDAVFHIEDTSTNGVFMNTLTNRLVPGRCYALQSGDRIFIDPYVIDVQVSSRQLHSPTVPEDVRESRTSGRGQLAAEPFTVDDPFGLPPASRRSPAERTSHPDPAEPGPVPSEEVDPLILLGPEPTRTPMEQQAPTMPDVDQTLVPGRYSPPSPNRPTPPAPASPAPGVAIPEYYDPLGDDFIAPPTPPAQPTSSFLDHVPTGEVFVVSEPTRTPPAQPGDLTDLLAGAGLTHIPTTPDLARRFGETLRVAVAEIMDALRDRQVITDEFRMRMTRFPAVGNNPLKFSANVDDALHNLLVKRSPAYLAPVEAFEEALADLRNHHVAMLPGMRAAFESALSEFEPGRLQHEFDRHLRGSSFLRLTAKFRYWELYCHHYDKIVKDPGAAFDRLFGEKFADAYEEQLRRGAPIPSRVNRSEWMGHSNPVSANADGFSPSNLPILLEALGLDLPVATPEFARTLGRIVPAVVTGVLELMRSVQQTRDGLRVRSRRLSVTDNNRLQRAQDVQDAVSNLFGRTDAGALPPARAFQDAFADLRHHHLAALVGMRAAVESMLASFDPHRLQLQFDRHVKMNAMPAKFWYWDLYRRHWREIMRDPEASFWRLCGEQFASAYEEQLEQLKIRAAAPPKGKED